METGQAIQCTCTVYCLQTFPLQLGFLYQLVVLSRDGLQPSSIYSYNYTMYIAYTQLGFSINQQYCHRPGCSPHLYIVIICILPTHSWVSPSTSSIVTGRAVALIYTYSSYTMYIAYTQLGFSINQYAWYCHGMGQNKSNHVVE